MSDLDAIINPKNIPCDGCGNPVQIGLLGPCPHCGWPIKQSEISHKLFEEFTKKDPNMWIDIKIP